MRLTPSQARKIAVLGQRAMKWSSTRKVHPHDREDVVQNAMVTALASETYDEARGPGEASAPRIHDGPRDPLEAWFRTLVKRAVAKHFHARARAEERLPEQVEDEIAASDPGMDRVDGWDFEHKVTEAAFEAYRACSDATKDAVALRVQGLEISEIAARLNIKEGAVRARLSRYGEEFESRFGRQGFGNRVNITYILQFIPQGAIQMGAGSVFMTGSVGGDFAANSNNNNNNAAVDVRFDHVVAGMGRMKAFIENGRNAENDRNVPVEVKARVVEGLDDIQSEASTAVPSLETIRGIMGATAAIFPGIEAIAKSLGVPWFT